MFLSSCASTLNGSKYTFEPSPTPYENVLAAQSKATKTNKLLLVVLGASWCHDSTALAKQFGTPEMQLILEAHYETIFVDVGLLEDRRQITQHFSYPIYYATPTVMVVEPESSALLNRVTMDKWGHAASIPHSDYVEYFSSFPVLTSQQKSLILNWHPSSEEVTYNDQHAERLQQAYNTLAPQLAKDIQGKTPEGFYDLWKEVKVFRSELQKSLTKRAEHALDEIENGRNEALSTPAYRHYHPFSWESKS
ncbi:hypothetical protein D210916BOD24_25690 [Alteromonas sp. D210916BOD_24]